MHVATRRLSILIWCPCHGNKVARLIKSLKMMSGCYFPACFKVPRRGRAVEEQSSTRTIVTRPPFLASLPAKRTCNPNPLRETPGVIHKMTRKSTKISPLRHVLAFWRHKTSSSTTMSNQGGRPGGGGGDAAMGAASSDTSDPLSPEQAVGEKRKAPAGEGSDTAITTAAQASTSPTSRKRSKKRPWTAEEDANLLEIVLAARSEQEESGGGGGNPEVTDEEDDDDWDEIAQSVPDRTAVQCLQRYLHLEKKRKGSVCLRTHALNSLTTIVQ